MRCSVRSARGWRDPCGRPTCSPASAATSSDCCSGAPSGQEAALAVADKVREALRRPFEVQGLHLHVTGQRGIALFPTHADEAQQLLQHADVAMYQAKASHSGHEIYARDRDEHSREALALACELPEAIASTASSSSTSSPSPKRAGSKVVGMEALVRWAHPHARPAFAQRLRPAGRAVGADARPDALGPRRRARPLPRLAARTATTYACR